MTDDYNFCKNCRFMREGDQHTECHRRPPDAQFGWPWVKLYQWCGEHEYDGSEDVDE